MPAAKPTSLNHPACLPRLALVAAVVLGLGLSLLGADATAQTRATLVPAPEEASNTHHPRAGLLELQVGSDRR